MEAVEALGRAAAEVLGAERLAVGRDTRVSGPAFVEALCRGVNWAGGIGSRLGRGGPHRRSLAGATTSRFAGAVVSASHNPWHDNGVKLFAPGGHKLSDEAQRSIEPPPG